MPGVDIVALLNDEYGASTREGKQHFHDQDGNLREITRPQVFEDYESQRNSVDIANNRRDDLFSFHDVMRTYRWELRCLSLFLGVIEANSCSAYKHSLQVALPPQQ
ncbi:uncharacterized protein BYT42DRAFT_614720 [Radiomyces spectabilis]|uniref:uncharacterized protein n=1 Tax=Radiomyces spectabilis TaxID=64574 RepID=UPI00221FEB07|nr:uncharacterized protein BYT42DRAFT_614720 [Radiomyces spectabilis]KAI8375923.1 hypothetical protein BYT42DRAFT_614720 [Radiomyces spectabilis]